MATIDPFAKERANLATGKSDEGESLMSALGQPSSIGKAAPIVRPALPTGAKPVSAAIPKTGDELIAAGRVSSDEDEISTAMVAADEAKRKADNDVAAEEQRQKVQSTTREAEVAEQYASKFRTTTDKQKEMLNSTYGYFTPSKETAADIAGIFSLMTLATMGGGTQSKYSGMNALASLTGAMKGYKEGREDLYKKEMGLYEKNVAEFGRRTDSHLKELKLALDELSVDKDAAMARARAVAAADTGSIAALKIRSGDLNGAMKALQHQHDAVQKLKQKDEELKQKHKEFLQRQEDLRESRAAQAGLRQQMIDLAKDKGELVTDKDGSLYRVVGDKLQKIEGSEGMTKIGTPSKAGAGVAGGQDVALIQNYGFPENEVARLNPKNTLPASVALVYSAEQTKTLANDIRNNPEAAGLALSFLSKIDKFLPSRYDTASSDSGISLLSSSIDTEITGKNPDTVSKARQIAKDAVDVINARALAASGGAKVLVAELRMQKDVIGLEGMSPKSAVAVFDKLAEKDMQSLKKFGFSQKTLDDARKRILVTTAPSAKPVPTISSKEQYDALPPDALYMEDGKQYRKPK